MIVIFSFENDPTTDKVIDWLLYFKVEFIRINSEDISSIKYFDLFTGEIEFNNEVKINLNNINIAWYRRGGIYKKTENYNEQYKLDESTLFNEIIRESNEIVGYIYYYLNNISKVKWLSNPFSVKKINKLGVLKQANDLGINVSKSFLIGSNTFFNYENEYITKPISDGNLYSLNNNFFLKSFTNIISKEMIESRSGSFFPSFIQKKIERVLELRVFYIDKKFYSTAMKVEDNLKIDVKLATGINETNVNYIPYELDVKLKNKLIKLMNHLDLNLGTFDLILNPDGEIYFIEMNPVGQFMGYSYPCNFMLDKIVAEYLVKNNLL